MELSPRNIEDFRRKMNSDKEVELYQGNAVDLSMFPDGSFDIVLLFGPLYHLGSDEDKLRCIAEAVRVCKDSGKLFLLS